MRQVRNVTIVFRCDPEAGVGHPDVPHGHNDIEFETCEYEFVWTTVYACPVCSASDYTAIVGQCDMDSNTQPVSYAWTVSLPVSACLFSQCSSKRLFHACKVTDQWPLPLMQTQPKRCHGGVALPAASSQPCSVDVMSCPPGYYAGTTGCVPAPAGSYR